MVAPDKHWNLNTHNSIFIRVEVVDNMFWLDIPEENIATIAAADDKFALRTVKVDAFNWKQKE